MNDPKQMNNQHLIYGESVISDASRLDKQLPKRSEGKSLLKIVKVH